MEITMSSFVDAEPTPLIASRWQRILAFIFDMILVVVLTTIIGAALAPVWKQAGEFARFAGLAVGMFYFAFGDRLGRRVVRLLWRASSWIFAALKTAGLFFLTLERRVWNRLMRFLRRGNHVEADASRLQFRWIKSKGVPELDWQDGQTLGMYLTNCKLVSLRGKRLPWYRAMIRFVVFAGLLVSFGARGSGNPQLDMLVAGAVAGVFAMTIYLLLFNRTNRRGLHDILAGSVVINEEFTVPDNLGKTWRWHSLFLVLVFLGGFAMASGAVQEQGKNIIPQPALHADLSATFPTEKFEIFVQKTKREVNGEEQESEYLVISITNPADQRDLARAVEYVSMARDELPTSGDMRRIVVRYVDAYHVGYSFSQQIESFVYTPTEWERLIDAEDREALIAEIMAEREEKEKKQQQRGRGGN